jgi:hypothetical protein
MGGIGGGASGMGGSGGGASGSGGGASGMGGSGGGASGMGGSGGGGAGSGDGQVVAPWDTLCVLEFTADYDVRDFGDLLFTAKSGDRYLMGSTSSFVAATILYLTPEGQVELDIEDDAEFTSNCMGSGTDHAAVFADTVVYADEALTMERCMLEAGTHAPGSVGFALAGEDIFTSNTYEITFTGLESFCDGMSAGFVEGTNVTIGNASFGQPAIANVLAP